MHSFNFHNSLNATVCNHPRMARSYPFGMLMPNRVNANNNYGYGFDRMRKDDEVSGSGNSLDFGARIYNPRLGRWSSVDPLTKSYPFLSPYNFVSNMPILAIDIDGKEIGIVVVSMANSPGAGSQGHMAIIVGNDEIGYWIFSLEQPKNLETYVNEDEVIFTVGVVDIEAYISNIYTAIFYGHREETMGGLLEYVAENAPGVTNDQDHQGFGYDRVALLKDATPEQEAALLDFLQSQTGEGFTYEFATNNCSSLSLELLNEFLGGIILDKTKVDRPNHEFDKIKKDSKHWDILKDDKKVHDKERKQNKKENKEQKKADKKKQRKERRKLKSESDPIQI